MPIERKPAKISNHQFLKGLLYLIENGCDFWGHCQKIFGTWHTIQVKLNRQPKNGTIQRIFEEVQKQKIINIQSEVLSLDSTSVKVHSDEAGARKSSGEQNLIQKTGKSTRSFRMRNLTLFLQNLGATCVSRLSTKGG